MCRFVELLLKWKDDWQMLRFGVCVFLALGLSVVLPLQLSYKYAKQAGPLAGGVLTSSNEVKDKGDPNH